QPSTAPAQESANAGASTKATPMAEPRLTVLEVDWAAAAASLADVTGLMPAALPVRGRAERTRPPAGSAAPDHRSLALLAHLNATMAQRIAGLSRSAVPVLLPFDVEALLRDQSAGTAPENSARYFG